MYLTIYERFILILNTRQLLLINERHRNENENKYESADDTY